MLLQTWKSADNIVRKDIIKPGTFSRKPTDCASCEVVIENINVINATVEDLKNKFNSQILHGTSKEVLTIDISPKLKRVEDEGGEGSGNEMKPYKIINHDEAAATASIFTRQSEETKTSITEWKATWTLNDQNLLLRLHTTRREM